MVLALRWFLATLKGQFTRRETETGTEKKPLNPILGELFLGSWQSENTGELRLWTEQVSHHPPVSAYCLLNAKANISYQGHCGQKTSFSGKSVIVKQVGHGLLKLTLPDNTVETYLITLPKLRIEGLWMASPYVELTEGSHIQSSSGYHTVLEYRGKGYFTGKAHSFTAKIYDQPRIATGSHPIYQIEGQWHGISKFVKRPPAWWTGEGDTFLDQTDERLEAITVQDISEQGPLESRRVWRDVANGIRKCDFESASLAKSKLENDQRAKRKEELTNGTPWQMTYFERVDSDEEYAKLAEMCGHLPTTEEAYRFKGEKEYKEKILSKSK